MLNISLNDVGNRRLLEALEQNNGMLKIIPCSTVNFTVTGLVLLFVFSFYLLYSRFQTSIANLIPLYIDRNHILYILHLYFLKCGESRNCIYPVGVNRLQAQFIVLSKVITPTLSRVDYEM